MGVKGVKGVKVFSVGFLGLVVGFSCGFGRTKTTPKCNMGFDSDTLSKKMLKHLKNEVLTNMR